MMPHQRYVPTLILADYRPTSQLAFVPCVLQLPALSALGHVQGRSTCRIQAMHHWCIHSATPPLTSGCMRALREAGVHTAHCACKIQCLQESLVPCGSLLENAACCVVLTGCAARRVHLLRPAVTLAQDCFELGVILLRKKLYTQATKNLEKASRMWDGEPEELAQVHPSALTRQCSPGCPVCMWNDGEPEELA